MHGKKHGNNDYGDFFFFFFFFFYKMLLLKWNKTFIFGYLYVCRKLLTQQEWHSNCRFMWNTFLPGKGCKLQQSASLDFVWNLEYLNDKPLKSYYNCNNMILIGQYVFWVIPSFFLMTLHCNYHPRWCSSNNKSIGPWGEMPGCSKCILLSTIMLVIL